MTNEDELNLALRRHAESPDDLRAIEGVLATLDALKLEDQSEIWARKALALAPNNLEFHYRLARALSLRGRHHEAISVLRPILDHVRPCFLVWALGDELLKIGETDQAIVELQQALRDAEAENAPFKPLIELTLGAARLKRGDPAGFHLWLSRNMVDSGCYAFAGVPLWRPGVDPRGKRILITHQIGFGDQFLLFACVRDWLAAGAILLVTCDEKIHGVIQASFPEVTVVAADRPMTPGVSPGPGLSAVVESFRPEFHLTLLHLPFLAVEEASPRVPFFRPYLRAPAQQRARAADWSRQVRHGAQNKRIVGLFWDCAQRWVMEADASTRSWCEERSLPEWALAELVNDPRLAQNVRFVCLQHPFSLLRAPPDRIGFYTPGITDFADTAACIEQLDCVVSVDAVAANLGAMIGKPTLVLTPRHRDWRWGREGTATPWMEGVHVIQQKWQGEWAQVIEEAVAWLIR